MFAIWTTLLFISQAKSNSIRGCTCRAYICLELIGGIKGKIPNYSDCKVGVNDNSLIVSGGGMPICYKCYNIFRVVVKMYEEILATMRLWNVTDQVDFI